MQGIKKSGDRLIERISRALRLLRWVLKASKMFVELAKDEGDTDAIAGYVYDSYLPLMYPEMTLQLAVDELEDAIRKPRNGSKGAKQKHGKDDSRSSRLLHLSHSLSYLSERISDYESPKGSRGDFQAIVLLLTFEYDLWETQYVFRDARDMISHPLMEDAGVLLGVMYQYMPNTYEMVAYYIPNDGRGDWIVDSASRVFAKLNERRFEIEDLASRLLLIDSQLECEEKAVAMNGPRKGETTLSILGASCHHSADFRSVVWFGTNYSFTPNQAKCINVLWNAFETGMAEFSKNEILNRADLNSDRLVNVFKVHSGKRHPAWKTMICPGETKGTYCLKEPGTQ